VPHAQIRLVRCKLYLLTYLLLVVCGVGSPFTVEVIDPGTVIARGEGLISGQAHQQAVFTVGSDNGVGVNVGDCRISIYGTYSLYCLV